MHYELIIKNWTWGISSVGLEHLPCTQGVKGSSPLFSTKDDKRVILIENKGINKTGLAQA